MLSLKCGKYDEYIAVCALLKLKTIRECNLIFTHLTLNITLTIQLKFIKITDRKQQSNNSYSLFSHWDVQPITHPLPSHDQYTDLLSNNKGIALKLTVRYPPNLKFCVSVSFDPVAIVVVVILLCAHPNFSQNWKRAMPLTNYVTDKVKLRVWQIRPRNYKSFGNVF